MTHLEVKEQLAKDTKVLAEELRRLTPDQMRVGRDNARHAVLVVLRRIRHVVDQNYPVIPKTATRKLSKDPMAVIRRLRADGWIPSDEWIGDDEVHLAYFAEVGVKIRTVPLNHGRNGFSRWAPKWAALVPTNNLGLLRKLKNNPAARKEFLVLRALEQDT